MGQTVEGNTTDFALDIAGGLPEVIYTSESEVYLHLPGVIVTQKAGDVRYLLSDGLGSIRQAVDENGMVVAYNEFDPYGNPVVGGGALYGYTGEWWEEDVELLHLRARWYTPGTGTFLSRDPVESEPAYQYVRENPINRVDPSGFCAVGTCGADVTDWLLVQMKRHFAYGRKINGIRSLMYANATLLTPPGFVSPTPLSSIAFQSPFREIVKEFNFGVPQTDLQTSIPIGWTPTQPTYVEALGVLEYALYGLAVDYANVNYQAVTPLCGSEGCIEIIPRHTSVTLCGKCIDSSDVGNMMFGLGGAARGYDPVFTYGSAATFNLLADWLPGKAGFVESALSPDGRGAIPGYLIGTTAAYLNQWTFCKIVNGSRIVDYNDARAAHEQCQSCSEKASPITVEPSSLSYVSGRSGSTIVELKGKLGLAQ